MANCICAQRLGRVYKNHFKVIMNDENEFVAEEIPAVSGPGEEFNDTISVNDFKASGRTVVNTAIIEAAGYCRTTMIRENANYVLLKNTLPEELKHSSLVSLYKRKGIFCRINLLEHGLIIIII